MDKVVGMKETKTRCARCRINRAILYQIRQLHSIKVRIRNVRKF